MHHPCEQDCWILTWTALLNTVSPSSPPPQHRSLSRLCVYPNIFQKTVTRQTRLAACTPNKREPLSLIKMVTPCHLEISFSVNEQRRVCAHIHLTKKEIAKNRYCYVPVRYHQNATLVPMTKTFILITVYVITFLLLDVYFSVRLIHILCIAISQTNSVMSPLEKAG